jgi:hypothetical protein
MLLPPDRYLVRQTRRFRSRDQPVYLVRPCEARGITRNCIFMPLVFDLREQAIHWLDVQAKGQLEMNNVEMSQRAIAKICPQLMTYFGSGVRASMWDLCLLHAAARCQQVTVRAHGKAMAASALPFSTYFGASTGENMTEGEAVGLDAAGNFYVAGATRSWALSDAFVLKFDVSGKL